MVNAHAEIDDPAHPVSAVITGQKAWTLGLFTDLVRPLVPAMAGDLGRTLMLLHEGALVAHGLRIFPRPMEEARERARLPIAAAGGGTTGD